MISSYTSIQLLSVHYTIRLLLDTNIDILCEYVRAQIQSI